MAIPFKKEEIIKGLSAFPEEKVEQFATYCIATAMKKEKKDGKEVESFICKWNTEKLITLFKRVASDGLFIDGKSISLTSRGVQYDYQAYKNKMYMVYSESVIDVQLVYKEDSFKFKKESGKVIYTHEFGNPFERKDADIIGGYCVIKNRRGEFITTMTREEIEKHRKVASTDKIWKDWYVKMALKTLIKSACSLHFRDVYQNIEEIDNENYNLENPVDIDIDYKSQIDEISELKKLREFYNLHKDKFTKNQSLLKYIQQRQAQIKKEQGE